MLSGVKTLFRPTARTILRRSFLSSLSFFSLIAFFAFYFTSCQPQGSQPPQSSQPSQSSRLSQSSQSPLRGQAEVTRQEQYRRIVAGDILSAEILWRLGPTVRKRVVAIPAMIDDRHYSDFVGFWPAELPKFHRASEEIVAFEPDLVISSLYGNAAFTRLLQKAGIDFLQLEISSGFASYRKNVQRIAATVGLPEKGKELINRFNRRLAQIQKKALSMPPLNAVSYLYGYTAGKDTTFSDALQAAGLTNLAAQKGMIKYSPISVEQLLVWRPDIIVTACANQDCGATEEQFARRLGLKKIGSQVLALPANLLSNANENMLAIAESLQKRLIE